MSLNFQVTEQPVVQEVLDYFHQEGLDAYFAVEGHKMEFDPNFNVDPNNKTPYPPQVDDLVRLHRVIRERKVFTVLEFGLGYSTVVMADAIRKNQLEYESLETKPKVRRNNSFEVHSVDASLEWIEHTRSNFPSQLQDYVHFHNSGCKIGTFNSRLCHYYESIPDVAPDFVYLDGPAATDVQGKHCGLTFECLDRTVMSADLLMMEPTLLPGALILVDGRTNNARFLKNNFQRNFDYHWDQDQDVHHFELREEPLGIYNEIMIEYCLGSKWLQDVRNVNSSSSNRAA